MKYYLIKRHNPHDRTAPEKYYPQLILSNKLGLREFAEDIVGRSSLTLGDVENCLENFIDQIPFFLLQGHSIKLGEFGTFRLSVLSNGGALTIGDWDSSLIKCVKVIFTPGSLLKKRLKNEATFELSLPREAVNARRISRAKAILRDEEIHEQTIQEHFQSLDKEEALRQLRALQQQIETLSEASDVPASETPLSSAPSPKTSASKASRKSDNASDASSIGGDTPPK